MAVQIHPSSIIESGAELGERVAIGPFCTVGRHVQLAEGVQLVSHVAITGNTRIGPRCVIYPQAALGHSPQDLKYKGEDTRLIVGADNVFREGVVLHVGTVTSRGQTVVGDRSYFMAHSHIGHDCIIGDSVVVGNNVAVGGSAEIEDFVILGGNSAVHQMTRIGKYAFIGGVAAVVGDVIPFGMVDNDGRLNGLNLVGLKRRGFRRETINELRGVYHELFHGAGRLEERLAAVTQEHSGTPEVMMILDFLNADRKRGLCLPRSQ